MKLVLRWQSPDALQFRDWLYQILKKPSQFFRYKWVYNKLQAEKFYNAVQLYRKLKTRFPLNVFSVLSWETALNLLKFRDVSKITTHKIWIILLSYYFYISEVTAVQRILELNSKPVFNVKLPFKNICDLFYFIRSLHVVWSDHLLCSYRQGLQSHVIKQFLAIFSFYDASPFWKLGKKCDVVFARK